MAAIVTITTTLGSRDAARGMAAALVEERLAACVQIAPIESCYRWDGGIERADEWQLVAKTSAACAPAAQARIAALHAYALPEIVIANIEAVPAYRDWIAAEVAPPD